MVETAGQVSLTVPANVEGSRRWTSAEFAMATVLHVLDKIALLASSKTVRASVADLLRRMLVVFAGEMEARVTAFVFSMMPAMFAREMDPHVKCVMSTASLSYVGMQSKTAVVSAVAMELIVRDVSTHQLATRAHIVRCKKTFSVRSPTFTRTAQATVPNVIAQVHVVAKQWRTLVMYVVATVPHVAKMHWTVIVH